MEQSLEKRLKQRGIRVTAVRLLVAQSLHDANGMLTLADLEMVLNPVPKSSISRALHLFVDKHIVHCVEDGSGLFRYELCDSEKVCGIEDLHTHFYCEKCHSIHCLKTIRIPVVEMPNGFEMHSVNYMIKGFCDKCSGK